jgi:thiol-disulfide isomerase/thioredoxin
MSLLSRPIIRMPHLQAGEWLNSPPLVREQLHGRVVLIDFWEYSCLYCLQTLPYLNAWHERYAPHGLQIIGIHTPEFQFGAQLAQVEAAVQEQAIRYPVLLDNAQANWDQFATKAWPSKYLIDPQGYIRYMHQGASGYRHMELAIQQLLQAHNPALALPTPLPPFRPEDQQGAACYPSTAELHAGYSGGLFGGALGNPDGYYPNRPTVYAVPEKKERQEGRFYLGGIWQASAEALSFVGQEEGQVWLPYTAVGVHALLSPTADDVTLRLGLWQKEAVPPLVELLVDGRPPRRHELGKDAQMDEHGRVFVPITRPRLYHLLQHPTHGSHELTLICRHTGLALYAFTFSSCVMQLAT